MTLGSSMRMIFSVPPQRAQVSISLFAENPGKPTPTTLLPAIPMVSEHLVGTAQLK
jgi:hypothetical protein